MRCLTFALWLTGPFLGPPAARAVSPPPDFIIENAVPASSFSVPLALAFLPDGRWLVAEKGGRVVIVQNGIQLSTPLVDLSDEVLSNGDRGLTSIAVDPAYSSNRNIYLLYSVDPDSNGVDDDAHGFGRLTRYQLTAAGTAVVAGSRTILIGTGWQDGPLSASSTHTVNDLRWGADGSLLVAIGDGAHTSPDPGGRDSAAFLPGRADSSQDIGAFRSQDLTNLCGKILRIDPATGHGYPGNPFWDGNPASIASRIWACGLRNPFRFSIRPGTGDPSPAADDPGALFVGDVGWKTWEEIDVITTGGRNFGWPCYEGDGANTEYQALSPEHHACSSFTGPHTLPLLTYHHTDSQLGTVPGFPGNCVVGGAFYQGSRYPSSYQGALFFADFGQSLLRVAQFDPSHQLAALADFATEADNPVAISSDPQNGDILYISIATNEIRRIRYISTGSNLPPIPVANATPLVTEANTTVAFSSAGTTDPDGDPVTLFWDFGDGQGSVALHPSYSYNFPGIYLVQLIVNDDRGGSSRDSLRVVIASETEFPSTPLVDGFNRPNGPLGASWSGDLSSLAIVDSEVAKTGTSASHALWGSAYGSNQEAYVRLESIPTPGDVRLMLKASSDPDPARIEIDYGIVSETLTVSTYEPGVGYQILGPTVSPAFVAGDTIGARAWSTGAVEVFRNSTRLGIWSAGPAFQEVGGRIGFGFTGPGVIDDFGGGDKVVDTNTPPVATIVSPQPSTFFIGGAPFLLQGTSSDVEDGTAALARWEVDLVHNSHVHPLVRVIEGDLGVFVTENHEDGTGFHYKLRFIVTDLGGASDTAHTRLDPEVDFEPSVMTIVPDTMVALNPGTFSFRLHNLGGMPTPFARWRITAGATTLAEGDTAIASFDSVTVARTVFHNLLPGTYPLSVMADADSAVIETNESNNVRSRTLVVQHPVLPDYPATPVRDNFNRSGSLGAPWAGTVSGLDLNGNRLRANTNSYRGPVWSAQSFGPYQEAYVFLEDLKDQAKTAVLLKAQGTALADGRLEVAYEHPVGVRVRTYTTASGWVQHGTTISALFQQGDRLGGRALPDGTVEVYHDAALIGTRSAAAWPFAALGGLIGLSFDDADDSRVDDFGGGSIGPEGPPPNQPPVANASGGPLLGAAPLQVHFSSLGSVEPDGDPLFYGWTFGDNTSASTASPVHTYATAGSYTVRLTLDDGRGGTDTDSLVITVVPSTGFPATAVLDNFNRPDGPLGAPWTGDTEGVVISGGAFTPTASGYETPVFQTFFGPTQEAHVRILGLTVGAPQQGLVLKAQGTHEEAAKIEIRYEQILSDVVVSTHIPGEGWQEQGVLPLPLAPFDVLGARAHADGNVDVYRNGILSGTISVATWPFAGQGGYIGLQVVGGLATRFDDFGGGSLGIVDVTAEPALALPEVLALSRAFPNPSRSAVSFSLELPRAGTVSWTIHDLQGRALWREHRTMQPGRWTITWPGRVEGGALAPPGLYFADVTIGGTRFSRRLVLTR